MAKRAAHSRPLSWTKALVLVAALALWFLPEIIVLLVLGIDPREADVDQSGGVSWSEADYICNSFQATVVQDGIDCVEYTAKKDGLPIKVVCP